MRSRASRLITVLAATCAAALLVACTATTDTTGEQRADRDPRATSVRRTPEADRAGAARTPARDNPKIRWRRSKAVGEPSAGRLVRGVMLPAQGRLFFTWDPVRETSPNRPSRRFATVRLIRVLLAVLMAYAEDNPDAPRVGIGDLSRPRGGDFGRRFGPPGHVSHQNGLDADVYYPRRDGRETEPQRPGQIDRGLAQDLVDLFVAAGARFVFVGPNTGLTGPPQIVQPLTHHDNHMHVRIPEHG
jgi:murein endopeptidase